MQLCQVCLSVCPRCGKGGVPLEIHGGIIGGGTSHGGQLPLCWALLGSLLAEVNTCAGHVKILESRCLFSYKRGFFEDFIVLLLIK